MHSIWCMPLRVIWRTTERKSDREQLYTDTRPRCDFTLPGKYLQQARLGSMNATDDADTHSEGCSQSVLGYDHTPPHGALPHTGLVIFTDFPLAITTHHTALIRPSPLRSGHTTSLDSNRSLAPQITRQTCANQMLSASIAKFPYTAYTC
jgi:hypothetical protein